eukprot:9501231-Pyramimonas_sp.AAC.2
MWGTCPSYAHGRGVPMRKRGRRLRARIRAPAARFFRRDLERRARAKKGTSWTGVVYRAQGQSYWAAGRPVLRVSLRGWLG